MDIVNFCDIECLADYMYMNSKRNSFIVAILFYDKAIKLIKELLSFEDVQPEAFMIQPYDWDGYEKEYFVSLSKDDGSKLALSVEPAYHENGYYGTGADLLLIDGDANSLLLKTILTHDLCNTDINQCKEIHFGDMGENELEIESCVPDGRCYELTLDGDQDESEKDIFLDIDLGELVRSIFLSAAIL